jgi:hypothetical protein
VTAGQPARYLRQAGRRKGICEKGEADKQADARRVSQTISQTRWQLEQTMTFLDRPGRNAAAAVFSCCPLNISRSSNEVYRMRLASTTHLIAIPHPYLRAGLHIPHSWVLSMARFRFSSHNFGWNLVDIKEWFGLCVAASNVQLWECTFVHIPCSFSSTYQNLQNRHANRLTPHSYCLHGVAGVLTSAVQDNNKPALLILSQVYDLPMQQSPPARHYLATNQQHHPRAAEWNI